MTGISSQVECHSGFEYAQRPVAFTWQGARLRVNRILEQARIPEGKRFLVQAGNQQEFYLFYAESLDEWTILRRTY
ncbi:MAG TPA: hypothetical protein VJ436_10920 [Anaerolineales bacterium]|nr:hypothetical protein [Anaerolineales bacterium]